MAYIGNSPANIGNYQIVDNISTSFNGSLTSFALASGGTTITPAKSGQLLVNINGITQQPDDTGTHGFKVSGSSIAFSSAPASGDTFWAIFQGQQVDIGIPSNDTVDTSHLKDNAVTTGKIAQATILTEDIANSQITVDKMAVNSIDSNQYIDGSIDREHLVADIIDGTKIADNAVDSDHLAAGSIDLEHMASDSVDEDNLKISNTPSNGQFLSAQSGAAGGLTWAAVDALPSQGSQSGKYLTTNGSAASWGTVDALPAQSGNAGKFLTTDASNASWATLNTDSNTTTKGLYEMANTIAANYSITSGNNAISAGPITINSGVAVTVNTGSTWVIA